MIPPTKENPQRASQNTGKPCDIPAGVEQIPLPPDKVRKKFFLELNPSGSGSLTQDLGGVGLPTISPSHPRIDGLRRRLQLDRLADQVRRDRAGPWLALWTLFRTRKGGPKKRKGGAPKHAKEEKGGGGDQKGQGSKGKTRGTKPNQTRHLTHARGRKRVTRLVAISRY